MKVCRMSRAVVSVAVFGWIVLTMCSIAGTSLADEVGTPNKRLPNIVFILADDLGWSDTTLFDTSDYYRTPNVQRLARRGMTFDRAYAASPLCSPTRASILTGLSPARHGITSPNCHTPTVRLQAAVKPNAAAHQFSVQPDPVTRLDPKHITIAETLRAAGYATGHFGKWHLGAEPYSPLQHGFDIDVPHWHGPGPAGSYVAPWKFPDFDHDPDVPDQHIEDRMAKEAVQFMRQHRDQPFFLNYWMFSVHAPFDAKAALIEKYAKTVDPTDEQRCPTYAAMIESMDDAIGTLLDELDRLQVAENTIIVFASDNGGNMYNLVDGQRPTSNRPLRGGKATVYEGGIRTPAIVVWPGQVKSGTTSDAMIQSVDYFPTLLEMLGMSPASDQWFDGVSFVPALKGGAIDRDGIFTYFPHNPPVPDWLPPSICVHQDDWKLIRIFHGGDDTGHRYKLFNLRDDIGEQHDLSAMMPDRVRQMDALIERHLRETGAVVPQANPTFDPNKYDIASEGAPAAKFLPGGASTKRRKPAKPVAGWQPAGTCELSIGDGKLLVHSTGGDPYFSYRLQTPIDETAFVLQMEISSNAGGSGQVFWQTEGGGPFTAKRSEVYSPTHDGDRHSYAVKFRTRGPLSAVRIDPATDVGDIQVHALRLITQDGRLIHQWSF
ncbi:sulfatase [Crateriforma conspicua]|uniref:Arylsulfatase n=1 Tax=Crateriforma conspicua TaxID=2527996 RepID=A0A5C6FIN8_9PLAN|nr:sulfatase [Crateriforma conspicua]TWU62115.1 Arylsulfatase [Crateriforma conspicua]